MKTNMHHGATPAIFETAKNLRKIPTKAEAILWEHLRKDQIGYRFRRQHPLSKFIIDFYCHKLKLAIELDGEIHDQIDIKERDIEKEIILKNSNIELLRFRNDEIINSIHSVLSLIYETIEIRRAL